MSEEVNKKRTPKKHDGITFNHYSDSECHYAQRYRQTDRQTDDSIMPRADHTACISTID